MKQKDVIFLQGWAIAMLVIVVVAHLFDRI